MEPRQTLYSPYHSYQVCYKSRNIITQFFSTWNGMAILSCLRLLNFRCVQILVSFSPAVITFLNIRLRGIYWNIILIQCHVQICPVKSLLSLSINNETDWSQSWFTGLNVPLLANQTMEKKRMKLRNVVSSLLLVQI